MGDDVILEVLSVNKATGSIRFMATVDRPGRTWKVEASLFVGVEGHRHDPVVAAGGPDGGCGLEAKETVPADIARAVARAVASWDDPRDGVTHGCGGRALWLVEHGGAP